MRYLPLSHADRDEMLAATGASRIKDLFKDVPDSAYSETDLPLPDHKGEMEVEQILSAYAGKNLNANDNPFFLGGGVYHHHIPASVDHIIQRSEFLTAYTPYQPEIAQGTLQAVYEFQSIIARLTGQDIANASLYDGASATAEAALMAMRVKRRSKIIIGNELHPDYRDVLNTYLGTDAFAKADATDDIAAIIVQSPDFYGRPEKYQIWRDKADAIGALLIVVVSEIVSLGMLPAPESADIVCGEAQSIGLPMSFGGPHLGFFACKQAYLRQVPGRLCGRTQDEDGRDSYVLTLSTREQHIRREKATSNICTNQGLCALAFTVHMSLLGDIGFRHLAQLNHERACTLADSLDQIDGVTVVNENFFNEFVIKLPIASVTLNDKLAARGIIGGLTISDNEMLICATETTSESDIQSLKQAITSILSEEA